jgi:hypothetical protein
MKYTLLIYQGSTPTPDDPEAWGALSDEQRQEVYRGYQELNQTPGLTPGPSMGPADTATTVRVQDGQTLTTDGPFVETKEMMGGFWIVTVPDLDTALELAAQATLACRLPVEVRPFQDESEVG